MVDKMNNKIKEIYQFRQMLISIVRRDLRARYKGSFLGFLWTFVNPVLQLIVYSIVFPFLLRIEQENYPMFLFVALLPWIFFATSIQTATTSIVSGGSLVKKIYFPRLILPLSVVCTNLMNFLYCLIVVFGAIFVTGISLSLNVLWLPIVIVIEFIFILGLSILLSSFYVKFRDLEHIVNVMVFVWFYLTPVVFPMKIFPDFMIKILSFNPMVPIIESFRNVLLFGNPPIWNQLGYSVVLGLILLIIAVAIFTRNEKFFAEEL
jgi:ABC-2 type transport system permease protein